MKYVHKNQIDFPKNSIKELAHSFGCFSRFEIALTSMFVLLIIAIADSK